MFSTVFNNNKYPNGDNNVQLIQTKFQAQLTPGRQRTIATVLSVLLVLIALWWLAQLTWRVLTPADTLIVAPQQASRAAVVSTNVSALQNLNIFGDRSAPEPTQTSIDAPETTLNVRLVGLVASAQPERSAAIIEQSGTQQTYIIGERINNSRATVEQILPDRVLLDNGGRREVLYMEGRDGSEAQLRVSAPNSNQASTTGRTRSPSNDRAVTPLPGSSVRVQVDADPEVQQAVAAVREDPSAILQIINISPERNGQQITGYRLQPRDNVALFNALGLQTGDVALSINGYDLTDNAEALAAINELQDASRAIVQVRRGDQIIDLELQVP